jgi:formate dehydrogenase major subunit
MRRREFIKASCCLGTAMAVGTLGLDLAAVSAHAEEAMKIERVKSAKQTFSLCYYCSVTCGVVCSTDSKTGKIINIEGDPDSPINEGSLCAKGAALFQTTADNTHRLTKVKYRAPGSDKWVDKPMDWALDQVARKIKAIRDKDFIVKNADGKVVNRLETLGHMGSSKSDNEECWVTTTMMRALGLVNIDHQARV